MSSVFYKKLEIQFQHFLKLKLISGFDCEIDQGDKWRWRLWHLVMFVALTCHICQAIMVRTCTIMIGLFKRLWAHSFDKSIKKAFHLVLFCESVSYYIWIKIKN